jgi:nicotinate-nucleotide adenylyltransferase
VRWLRLALAGWRGVEVDTSELERGGVSYTINTIRHHRSRCPAARLFWLIGADHVALLPTWREADELAQLVEFAVVPRPGEPLPVAPAIFRVHALRGCLSGVSSSLVRGRVAAGLPIDLLVPANVAEAVHNSGLYLRNALTDDPSDGFAQAGSALPPTR